MDPNDDKERRFVRPVRALGFGLVAGIVVGTLELALRVLGTDSPSIARRVPELLVYAATWYGLAGGVAFALAAVVSRIGARQRWSVSQEGPEGVVLGALTALALPAAVVLWMNEDLTAHPGLTRVLLLGLALLLSTLVGWLVARRVSARPGGAVARSIQSLWAPRAALALLVAVGAGTAALLVASKRELGARPELPPREGGLGAAPSVVVVLVDTLRADALGCYGAARPTPASDALAARGAVVEEASAPASWTLPSVATLFTSQVPSAHGCIDFNTRVAEVDTLAGAFADAGYETLAVVGNPFVNRPAGFARGFHVFDVDSQEVEARLFSSRLFDGALRLAGLSSGPRVTIPWFVRLDEGGLTTRLSAYMLDEDLVDNVHRHAWPSGERPYLLYVQLVAPHTPYLEHPLRFLKNQPDLAEENLDALRERYLDEVRYSDAQIARLLDDLGRAGLLEQAYVVVTSDHGEEFLEHGGWEHGRSLYGEVVDVPLIVAGPGIEPGTRVRERVELMDLAPTLLDLAGLEVPASFAGRSVAGALRAGEPVERRIVFGETGPSALTPEHRLFSATLGRHRLIRKRTLEGELVYEEAYDVAEDPGERQALATRPAELAALLERLLAYEAEALERAASRDQGPAFHDPSAMKDLGYFGDDGEDDEP